MSIFTRASSSFVGVRPKPKSPLAAGDGAGSGVDAGRAAATGDGEANALTDGDGLSAAAGLIAGFATGETAGVG
jgi:hypothetical protein